MKSPDLSNLYSRFRARVITFDSWLKQSRARAWSVFAAAVIATIGIENLAISAGLPGWVGLIFAIPAFAIGADAYLCASKGAEGGLMRRIAVLVLSFILILGPTPSDIEGELRTVAEIVIGLVALALLVWLFFQFRAPTKRETFSHFTSKGRVKVRYKDEKEALVAAAHMMAKDGEPMNAYPCRNGGHWHIGHAH